MTPDQIKSIAAELSEALDTLPISAGTPIKISGKSVDFLTSYDQAFYQVGPLFFVPLRTLNGQPEPSQADLQYALEFYQRELNDLRQHYAENVFFILPTSAVKNAALNHYTALTIAAMAANADLFRGAVVIDAGAGSGTLSSIALGLGARHVILLDNTPAQLDMARIFLENQRWNPGEDFSCLKADLTADFQNDPSFQELAVKFRKHPFIALVNIGPWPHYGQANRKAVTTLALLKQLRLIINCGYLLSSSSRHIHHSREFDAIRDFLKEDHFDVETVSYSDDFYTDPIGALVGTQNSLTIQEINPFLHAEIDSGI
ncbi:MAG: hypothetical protein HYS56_06280 [Candidatus Omnitrophica bacterium]|nr:hypothetical protein [Candidatus Omnitrophota bacterium]